MVLEKLVVECDFKSIRNKSLAQEKQSNTTNLKTNVNDYINVLNMKNHTASNNFKIIDFDNFMNGNPLVQDNIDHLN